MSRNPFQFRACTRTASRIGPATLASKHLPTNGSAPVVVFSSLRSLIPSLGVGERHFY